MTLRNLRRSLLTAVSAGVLLSASAMAADKDKSKSVPFKAGVVINEVLGGPTPECYTTAAMKGRSAAMGSISGVGLASPIGAFTLTSQDCITSPSPPGPLGSPFLPPFEFSSQSVVLHTNNGDIFAEYSGTVTAQSAGPLVLAGTFTFTGGTGRYAGVKGSGTVDGAEDISTNPANGFVVLSGNISY